MIKRKSLAVAAISSIIISLVMIITLIGYVIYIEYKFGEAKHSYQYELQKVNAKVYSKYIGITGMSSTVEDSGPLKGMPVIEGTVTNRGARTVSDLLIKARFLDIDGAILYEVIFHPLEPSLGMSILPRVTIPFVYTPSQISVRPGQSVTFKKVLSNCPEKIRNELLSYARSGQPSASWSGRFESETLSLELT